MSLLVRLACGGRKPRAARDERVRRASPVPPFAATGVAQLEGKPRPRVLPVTHCRRARDAEQTRRGLDRDLAEHAQLDQARRTRIVTLQLARGAGHRHAM